MPTRSTDRRPFGAARFDPAVPVLRQISGHALPDYRQPLKSDHRAGC